MFGLFMVVEQEVALHFRGTHVHQWQEGSLRHALPLSAVLKLCALYSGGKGYDPRQENDR